MRLGFLFLFAGLVLLLAGLDLGTGPEVVTWPLLLAGLGIGALASQLGSVTVSSVPDEQSADIGGIQNSITFLGASIGTALAGAVLISALSASFFTGIEENPDVPKQVSAQAQLQLGGGVPFISDPQLQDALDRAGVDKSTATAVVAENEESRLAGLRAALAALAVLALAALLLTNGIPERQPSDTQGRSRERGEGTASPPGPPDPSAAPVLNG